MRLVCISDTHGQHHKMEPLPDGDVLVHAGDFCMRGTRDEAITSLDWISSQAHEHRVLIAGNHDLYLESNPREFMTMCQERGIRYLEDSGGYIDGVMFYGSPWTPTFGYGWAFNADRGYDIYQHWTAIPPETDVLITHGPPMQTLDRTDRGEHVGCFDLWMVTEDIQPAAHIFGHIHEAYGQETIGLTTYINASSCALSYEPVNPPIVFDL